MLCNNIGRTFRPSKVQRFASERFQCFCFLIFFFFIKTVTVNQIVTTQLATLCPNLLNICDNIVRTLCPHFLKIFQFNITRTYAWIYWKCYVITLLERYTLFLKCYLVILPTSCPTVLQNVGREKCQLLLLPSVGHRVSMTASLDWISKCREMSLHNGDTVIQYESEAWLRLENKALMHLRCQVHRSRWFWKLADESSSTGMSLSDTDTTAISAV